MGGDNWGTFCRHSWSKGNWRCFNATYRSRPLLPSKKLRFGGMSVTTESCIQKFAMTPSPSIIGAEHYLRTCESRGLHCVAVCTPNLFLSRVLAQVPMYS